MSQLRRVADKPNGHYDLAVIGAGSAGFSAAITAIEQPDVWKFGTPLISPCLSG